MGCFYVKTEYLIFRKDIFRNFIVLMLILNYYLFLLVSIYLTVQPPSISSVHSILRYPRQNFLKKGKN